MGIETLIPNATVTPGDYGPNWHLLVDEGVDSADGTVVTEPAGSTTGGVIGFPAPFASAGDVHQIITRWRARKTGPGTTRMWLTLYNGATLIRGGVMTLDDDFQVVNYLQYDPSLHGGPPSGLDDLRLEVKGDATNAEAFELDAVELLIESGYGVVVSDASIPVEWQHAAEAPFPGTNAEFPVEWLGSGNFSPCTPPYTGPPTTAIAWTASIPIEWIAANECVLIPVEWLGSVDHDEGIPVEWMAAILGSAAESPVEWLYGVANAAESPVEWLAETLVEVTAEIPVEWLVVLLIVADLDLEVDWLGGVEVGRVLRPEWLAAIQRDDTTAVEWLYGVADAMESPASWLQGAACLAAGPVDWLGPAESTAASPIEWSAGLASINASPVEWLYGVADAIEIPVDWMLGTESPLVLRAEWEGAFVSTLVTPLDWSGQVTRDSSVPVDWLYGVVAEQHETPVEWLARASQGADLLASWLGGLVVNRSVRVEWARSITGTSAAIPVAWLRLTVLNSDHSLAVEWMAPVRAEATVPVEWLVLTTLTVGAEFAISWLSETFATPTIGVNWLASQAASASVPTEWSGAIPSPDACSSFGWTTTDAGDTWI